MAVQRLDIDRPAQGYAIATPGGGLGSYEPASRLDEAIDPEEILAGKTHPFDEIERFDWVEAPSLLRLAERQAECDETIERLRRLLFEPALAGLELERPAREKDEITDLRLARGPVTLVRRPADAGRSPIGHVGGSPSPQIVNAGPFEPIAVIAPGPSGALASHSQICAPRRRRSAFDKERRSMSIR